jgi:hypothetical protein
MKKLFAVMIMVFAVVAANAQRTPVKVTDLQKSITDNIAKDYAGFTIKEATKVVSNNVTSYEVMVTKGTTHETLLYDANGKFVKKVVAQQGTVTTQKPMASSTEKKTTTTTQTKK